VQKACGANRNPYDEYHNPYAYDESTAFGNLHGSTYEETTLPFSSNRRTFAAPRGQDNTSSIPPQVVISQVIGEV
jgi:hypothetical protein